MSDSESKSLSQQLVAARINKGVSLEDVHRVTGISSAVLQGFEAEQYDVVEAVFTRLALGTYAAYLGLNEHAVLRAFDDEYGTTSDQVQIVSTGRIDEEKGSISSHIDGGILLVISLVGVALAVLSLVIFMLSDGENTQGSSTAAPSAALISTARTWRAAGRERAACYGPQVSNERGRCLINKLLRRYAVNLLYRFY